jgi:RNA polymerase sigma-70 factor, ECF subfamily
MMSVDQQRKSDFKRPAAEPLRSHADALATSRSLIERARHRDSRAWEQLVDLYAPLVYFWCRRAQVHPQDIADVVQDVFRAVVAGLPGFRKERPGDTFRGWLRIVTHSKVSDHFRRLGRTPQAAGGTDARRRLDLLPALLHRALESIREEFAPQVWQAFWRVAVDQQAVSDVAADLAMPPGTVRVYKCRVAQRLRQALGDVD